MKESTRKLLLFAGLFIAAAIIIFASMPRQAKPTEKEMPETTTMPDSEMNIEMAKIDQLKKAVESAPDNLDHLIQLGNLYFDVNQPQNAVEYYEKALAKDPQNPLVLTDCGIMYSQIGESDKALTYFDKAISLRPDLPQAYFNKGLILLSAKNDKPNAIKAWRQYLALVPDTGMAHTFKHQLDSLEAAP